MSKKVLLVDDDPTTVHSITRELSNLGYTVIAETNGVRGVMAAVMHKPDVILADFMMPGLAGQNIFKQLEKRKETKGIPIIVISGYPPQHIQSYLPAALRDRIFTKPLDFPKLSETIQKLAPLS